MSQRELHNTHRVVPSSTAATNFDRVHADNKTLDEHVTLVRNDVAFVLKNVSNVQDEVQIRTLFDEARRLIEMTNAFLDKVASATPDGGRKVALAKWPPHTAEAKELDQKFGTFFQTHSAQIGRAHV